MKNCAVSPEFLEMLDSMPRSLVKDRRLSEQDLKSALKKSRLKLTGAEISATMVGLSERDETAEICVEKSGNPEPDTGLRDHERVPLKEDIQVLFEEEVLPHVPDAWIDTRFCDMRDSQVEKVGYDINFNRHFYKYEPPRPLPEIETDIKQVEHDNSEPLKEVAG